MHTRNWNGATEKAGKIQTDWRVQQWAMSLFCCAAAFFPSTGFWWHSCSIQHSPAYWRSVSVNAYTTSTRNLIRVDDTFYLLRMQSVWKTNNISDDYSPRPGRRALQLKLFGVLSSTRVYSQWHNPNETKMAQHIQDDDGKTRPFFKSVRRDIVPFQITEQLFSKFVKRKTFDTYFYVERMRHGTGCHFCGFLIRTKKLEPAPDWRPSIDIRYIPPLQPSHLILRIPLLYRNNPISNARSSLLIFHYVHFWSAYLQPSIPLRISVSLHPSFRFNLPACNWLKIARLNDYYVCDEPIYPSKSKAYVLWCSGKQQ